MISSSDNSDKSDNTDTFFVRELNIRYKKTKQKYIPIRKAEDCVKFIRRVLPDNSREHAVALYLDGSHQVVSYSIVSTGTANQALVSPRDIFQRAVVAGAVAIILSHNHPSGNAQPSEEDRKVTNRLRDAGDLLGIKVLDHIIATDHEFYSFKDKGYL